MTVPFRVIDTGVRDGRRQIAFDQALIELHKAGRSPDTIRFLRFPPTALVGRHQVLENEVRLDDCRAHGIGLVRRITGGGAIYLDEGQIGWEIVLSRQRLPRATLAEYSQAICESVAGGLSTAFAIAARYRAPTDIEVGGAKVCGTGGYFDGDTLVYQGTVLVDLDPAKIASVLRLPPPKPESSTPPPMTTLKHQLGGKTPDVSMVQRAVLTGLANGLGLTLQQGRPTVEEEALAMRLHDEEIGTDAFVLHGDKSA
ncbi:MAG: biotin/lipoate A/B protein ligase family protein [Hyphomicrobiaceae bacterium]